MGTALVNVLSQDAIVAIHDTGCWSKQYLDAHSPRWHRELPVTLNNGFQWLCHGNSVEERRFVNWIRQKYPEFVEINFHTKRYLRNGVTLLQKQQDLFVGTPLQKQ